MMVQNGDEENDANSHLTAAWCITSWSTIDLDRTAGQSFLLDCPLKQLAEGMMTLQTVYNCLQRRDTMVERTADTLNPKPNDTPRP